MISLKCKNCGGDLEIIKNASASIAQCTYCGSMITLPKELDDNKVNLFNRANHYRVTKQFDLAIKMYNRILDEYKEEPEAYWGLVLSKYGIEYVDDIRNNKKVPTCNRTMLKSIYDDDDYKKVILLANEEAKVVYQESALAINEIHQKICKISSQEKPFDIFICYKESDENTKERTEDSVRAENLYNKLTIAGYRVFFARITLEDKLGKEYEPYIFAALNSAKIMIVIGSKAEYFNAVWVKNEWSRYLDIIKSDETKLLIPVYYNMNPYDIPMELSILQAQSMEKMGFEQDLIRVIQKNTKGTREELEEVSNEVRVQNLLERGYTELSNKAYREANKFFEKILELDVTCSGAYWAKMLTNLRCNRNEDIYSIPIIRLIEKEIIEKTKQLNITIDSVNEDIINDSIYIVLGNNYINACKYANERDKIEYENYYKKIKQEVDESIINLIEEEKVKKVEEDKKNATLEKEREKKEIKDKANKGFKRLGRLVIMVVLMGVLYFIAEKINIEFIKSNILERDYLKVGHNLVVAYLIFSLIKNIICCRTFINGGQRLVYMYAIIYCAYIGGYKLIIEGGLDPVVIIVWSVIMYFILIIVDMILLLLVSIAIWLITIIIKLCFKGFKAIGSISKDEYEDKSEL